MHLVHNCECVMQHAVSAHLVPFCICAVSLCVLVCPVCCRAKSSYTSTWYPMVTGDYCQLANIAGMYHFRWFLWVYTFFLNHLAQTVELL